MQKNINNSKRIGACLSAIMIIIPLILVIIGIMFWLWGDDDGFFVNGILLIYMIGGGAVIVGILAALKQRFKEIQSGEEDEAKKY